MKRILLAVFLIVVATSTFATPQCTPYDSLKTCDGHKHLLGGAEVFTEDFAVSNLPAIPQGACCTSYHTVVEGCPSRGYVNITNTVATNLVMRGWLQIGSATTAPAGSEFAVRFIVDSTVRGEYVRKITGNFPQGEEFNAIYPNLAAGSHQVRMQLWLIDNPGTSITVTQAFISAQGVPATLPAGTTANGATATIDNTWRQISDTLTFTNSVAVNLFTQGYVQFNGGPSGEHIAFSFSLDGANAQHTIEVAVPPSFPSGINLFDHYLYEPGYVAVPPGTHTLTMWAVNRDSSTAATIQWRQIEFMALTAGVPDNMAETITTTPVSVTTTGDGSVVYQDFFKDQASTFPWTKLSDITFGATGSSNPQNGAGEVAIELLGTSDNMPHTIEVGVEAVYDPNFSLPEGTNCVNYVSNYKQCLADFSIVSLKIPGGRHQKFLFTHPLWWGMASASNRIRLFARRDPTDSSNFSFTVGARYLSFRGIQTPNTTACQFD